MDVRKRTFKPYRQHGRPGWVVTFWHPQMKKAVCRGLGTTDQREAEVIVADLRAICADPVFWNKANTREGFHPRACDAFFGAQAFLSERLEPGQISAEREFRHVARVVEQLKTTEYERIYQRIIGGNPYVEEAMYWEWPAFKVVYDELWGHPIARRHLVEIMIGWSIDVRNATLARKCLEAQVRMAREPQAPAATAAPQHRRRGKGKT